jgi:hypothetical protein
MTPALAQAPTHVLPPVIEKAADSDDNVAFESLSSITRFGYNIHLSSSAIAGQKIHCSYLP